MNTTPSEILQNLLKHFTVAMFVTRTENGQLRSRPMVVAQVEPDGSIWLLSDKQSGKSEDVNHDSHVNVAMQSDSKFVSITGTAAMVSDRKKLAELWNESWKVWFPDGLHDANLVLIKIRSDCGEYWDNSGMRGITYLIKAGQAYLTGNRPKIDGDVTIHGKVHA